MLFTWMNPKASAGVVGALASFTSVNGDMPRQIAVVTSVLAATCLLSCATCAALSVVIGQQLYSAWVRTAFNWSMAGLLALSLLPVFW